MAQRLKKTVSEDKISFSPEADGDFDIVSIKKITEWREKLNNRFGIGSGKLVTISEPTADA
ncbi:hypothetical protein [Pacificibacter sp. AS14]|uniref:hypothetical protein n=1 Tax=Pacificibacter sp. AS14 TaxID=3135785 RepID=UPI00317EAA3C